jgi:hypothetical protein
MEQYKLSGVDPIRQKQIASVIRLSDGAFIPFDLSNSDYQQYLKDVENGAEVLQADE